MEYGAILLIPLGTLPLVAWKWGPKDKGDRRLLFIVAVWSFACFQFMASLFISWLCARQP